MLKKATSIDLLILSIFTIFITFQPYFLWGEINLFEFGIYLPNINAVLDGLIPYRDFFHLRGPLELYIPALFMNIFGENLAVLEAYFYIGTIATLIICLCIGKELYQTRFVLYLMTLILIGRTFPRAVFNNWGGMRFGLGLLALLFAIYFFKRRKHALLFWSGVITSCAFLTSIEIGFSAALSITLSLMITHFLKTSHKLQTIKAIRFYLLGILTIALPYTLYLVGTNSLSAYFEMTYAVVANMTKVFPDYLFEDHPRGLLEALLGLNPFSRHFQHLTPAYCYLFFALFFLLGKRKSQMREMTPGIITVAIYGLILYVGAFRKLGAAQFEMALQPEKIVLFYMLEHVFFFFKTKWQNFMAMPHKSNLVRVKIFGISFLIFAFFMSSVGYAIARFNHRFPAYKYVKTKLTGGNTDELLPLNPKESQKLALKRLAGLVVPAWQATEMAQLTEFVEKNTDSNEPVFMFPEQGAYSFIVDRPFIGRFPMVTFSWIGPGWHDELFGQLKEVRPRFAFVPKVKDATFEKVYFKVGKNKANYDQIRDYIMNNYQLELSTHTLQVYRRRGN